MTFPPQHQEKQPGRESDMNPKPLFMGDWYKGSGKLLDKVAIITGGDSGIGRSIAVFFAKEGANVMIVYFDEHEDAQETKRIVESFGRKCETIAGDLKNSSFCKTVVERTVNIFGRLDILVNNAAMQVVETELKDLSDEQLEATFRTNIFAYFYMAREALKFLPENNGAAIINTTSVTAYHGHKMLLDYSATKGAIVTFTRSLALALAQKGIRVNGVAPGPIWTPLIPASFPNEKVENFGKDTPMGRAGQPEEVAPAYVFLASRDSSYLTGQIIHPNGGDMVTD